MRDQSTLWNLWYVDKDQCWGTVTWTGGAPGSGCPNTPAATITAPSQTSLALTQTNTWLQSGTVTGAKTCTGTPPNLVCTLPMLIGGNAAQIIYYTGWLTSHTQSTSFTTQQNIQGVTSATGGSVTLTQSPILLTSPGTTFTLSTGTTGTGSGTITGCAGNYAASAPYSCTVTASTGSTPTSVTGCGGSGTTTYTGVMPASNCAVTATFTLNSYTLSTATAGTGAGTITGCAGSHLFGAAYSCTVTATSPSTLTSVSGCGGSGTTTYTGSQPASNCTVTATFTAPTAATPVISPAAGAYFSTQSVTIADTTPGSSIYYTTNGTTPTTGSTLYTGAISVSSTTTVKAIAAASGYTNSAVASSLFTISSPGTTSVSVTGSVKISGTVGVQ